MTEDRLLRFKAKFTVGEKDECWNWKASKSTDGYGMFRGSGRKVWGAHRVAWELQNGPIPEGLKILHKCDNPACVNHHHLFLGTAKTNAMDRDSKGRAAYKLGERHPSAKLEDVAIRNIIALHHAGLGLKILSKQFGVALVTIRGYVSGHSRSDGSVKLLIPRFLYKKGIYA